MIIDLYAGGCRGWGEGMRALGLESVGLELDPWACASAVAAGHATVRADVAAYPPERFASAEGVTASPPCQSFSTAGQGEGRKVLDRLVGAVHAGTWHSVDPDRSAGFGHVLEVGRWVEAIRPTWVACEQVPPVLPVWRAYAERWRAMGWSTWAGVVNAADVGIPQTRERAILIARRDGDVARPPTSTHAKHPHPGLFGPLELRWVTMAEALGWGYQDRPARTLCGDRSPRWLYADPDGTHGEVLSWPWRQPATTVAGDPRITARCHHDAGSQGANAKTTEQVRAGDYAGTEPICLTLAEALTLQGFRAGYPVKGNKSQRFTQVGNAVPPALAMHVVAVASGISLEEAAA